MIGCSWRLVCRKVLTHLGPLTFVILIDQVWLGCLTDKFVYDITVTKIVSNSVVITVQTFISELLQQATEAGMIVNGWKTNECWSALFTKIHWCISHCVAYLERVVTFKLLWVHVVSDLKWAHRVDAITSKISWCLYLLKQLRSSAKRPTVLLYHSHPSSCRVRLPRPLLLHRQRCSSHYSRGQ